MKKILTLILVLLGVVVQAQTVQFDTTDVQALREIVFRKNPKGLKNADETLFKSMDSQVSKKGVISLSVVPNNYLYEYAERLYFQYQQYKRSEADAKRFLKIMKKIKETDPNFTGISENSFLKYDIDNIKSEIK